MVSNTTDNMVMPVSPMYGNSGAGSCFGGDGWWILLLLLFAGGWNNGFGGGFGGDGIMPYMWNAQTQNDVNRGFDNAGLAGQLSGITSAITSGFANAEVARCGSDMAAMQTAYTNQIASMNQRFADIQAVNQGFNSVSSQLAQCCCDNRLATAGIASDIAREACATRTSDTQNTQLLLNAINGGIQSIKDQICNDKIDAKNEKIVELQRELAVSTQNAFITKGLSDEVDQLYNRLANCPVPSTPVYGRTPIFVPTGATTPAVG